MYPISMCRRWKVPFTTKMFVFSWRTFCCCLCCLMECYSYCWYCTRSFTRKIINNALYITLLDRNKHCGNRQVLFMMELNTLHVFCCRSSCYVVVISTVTFLFVLSLRPRFWRIERQKKKPEKSQREEKNGKHCELTMKLHFSLLLKLLLVIQ